MIQLLISTLHLGSASGLTLHLQTCRRAASTRFYLHMLRVRIATCESGCSMDSRMSNVYQQNRTGEIYGSIITLTVIATVAVILRLFARKFSPASFWWDDWTIIIALVKHFDHSLSSRIYTDDFFEDLVFWQCHLLFGWG